jgi:hypothetical protein
MLTVPEDAVLRFIWAQRLEGLLIIEVVVFLALYAYLQSKRLRRIVLWFFCISIFGTLAGVFSLQLFF